MEKVVIDIKTHKSYYTSSLDDIKNSLDFAKKMDLNNLKINTHFYWRVPRCFERKQVLPIKSAIVNNKNNCDIYLWSNIDLSDNIFIKPLLPHIKLKVWDPIKEIKASFLKENLHFFEENKIDDQKCYLGGDLFRLLCLYKYGGMYIDMDMVVLRDLSPLFKYNFLYQWGSSGTTKEEPNLMINGAIMNFDIENKNLKIMLESLSKTHPSQNSFCWGKELYIRTRTDETFVFPCAWFNTEWGPGLPLEAFQKNQYSNELYDGAFTWHWHNRWDSEIEQGSKFQILESIVEEKFQNLVKA